MGFRIASLALALALALALPLAAQNPDLSAPDLNIRPAGLGAIEHPEQLPFLHPNGTETRQFASYDPSGANDDGNFKSAYTKYIDSNGEFVIFDASGPGCLYRQQYNVWWMGGRISAGQAHIRYYFDNETTPRVDLPVDQLFGGHIPPFTAPFAFLDPKWRFGILYYPFAFKTRLKITTTRDLSGPSGNDDGSWYQYTYLTYPDAAGVTSWAGPKEDSPAVREQWNHPGTDPKPAAGNLALHKTVAIPKGTAATLAELKGTGSIASLRIHIEPYSNETFYHTTLRIFWDGSTVPAVDLPLGYFFGGGGEKFKDGPRIPGMSLKTLFYGFDGAAHDFYSFWPMPYWRSARIELRNDSGADLSAVQCDLEYKPAAAYSYPQGEAGYFYAKRTLAQDPGNAVVAPVFEETGRGHVVGISFYTENFATDGDEFVYIDGSRTPQIHGDGTEDDHDQGYGGDAYQKAVWGGLINGFQGAYRIYMNDSYVFNRHIGIGYEHSRDGGVAKGAETDVTFYYYKAPGNLVLTDRLDVGNATSEASHQYETEGQTWAGTRRSGYDGYERNYEYDLAGDDGRAFNGHSEFTVAIDPGNQGVRLRRRIYRSGNGVQRATVYVDGVAVDRPWDIVTLSSAPSYQGWYDADFEIPASYSAHKSSIRVRVQYAEGGTKPEINEFYYWVYCYLDRQERGAPAAVDGLAGSSSGAFKADLKWTAAPVTAQVQYYQVYRSNKPDFSDAAPVGRADASWFHDARMRPGTTYTYRVAAVDLSGREGPTSPSVQVAIAAASGGSSAAFLGVDEHTLGTWGGKYGGDGFILARYFFGRDAQAWPDYLSAVDYGGMGSYQFHIWSDSTENSLEQSALVAPSLPRYLGALETKTDGWITLYINDTDTHQLALYFCDSDKTDRQEEIEVFDLAGHVLSPAQSVSGFEDGSWLRYRFSGSLKVHVVNRNPATTAVLSALMFDPLE